MRIRIIGSSQSAVNLQSDILQMKRNEFTITQDSPRLTIEINETVGLLSISSGNIKLLSLVTKELLARFNSIITTNEVKSPEILKVQVPDKESIQIEVEESLRLALGLYRANEETTT